MQFDQLSTIQKALLLLALIGLAGVFLQGPNPVVISGWRGSNSNSITGNATLIKGMAGPQTGRGLAGDGLLHTAVQHDGGRRNATVGGTQRNPCPSHYTNWLR